MADDRTPPGNGNPTAKDLLMQGPTAAHAWLSAPAAFMEQSETELIVPSSIALKNRYLAARGLEDSSYFHIGSRNGRNFAQFSTTPEGDAWTLAVVDSGIRYEMGVRPDNTGALVEYAIARKPKDTLVDKQARVEFASYLDGKYPEPTTSTEAIVDVVRGDDYQLLSSADARTYTRTQAIVEEVGSGRADGDSRGIRPSRDPESGNDGEPVLKRRETLYSHDTPEDRSQ